jgi:hypothetical protein
MTFDNQPTLFDVILEVTNLILHHLTTSVAGHADEHCPDPHRRRMTNPAPQQTHTKLVSTSVMLVTSMYEKKRCSSCQQRIVTYPCTNGTDAITVWKERKTNKYIYIYMTPDKNPLTYN